MGDTKELQLGDYQTMIQAAESGYNRYRGAFMKLDNCYLMRFEQEIIDELKKIEKPLPIYTPMFNAKAKRIMASFEGAYFESDEMCQVSDDDGKAEKEATAIQAELRDQTRRGFFLPLQKAFYDATVKGTAVVRSFWSGDSIKLEHVALKDFWFDPSALSHADIRYVIHRVYSTAHDIANLQEEGIYNNDFSPYELVKVGYQEATPYSKVALYEVYYLGRDGIWRVTTLYERTTILREAIELQDGLPFNFGVALPQAVNDLDTRAVYSYGDSPMGAAVSLQHEMNIRRNQQIEAVEMALKPRATVMKGSGINPMDMHKGAGSLIQVANHGAIEFIPAPNIQSSIFDVQRLDTEAQEAVGVTAYNSGNDMGQMMNRTATGIATLTQEGNTRISSYLRSFNETMMENLLDRVVKLIWKYADSDNFIGIDRNQNIEFKISINVGVGATNKQVQLNGMMQAVQMLSQVGAGKGVIEVVRRALPLLGLKDVDNILGAKDEEGGLGSVYGQQGMAGAMQGAEREEAELLQQSYGNSIQQGGETMS